jgi:UPF0755 protein
MTRTARTVTAILALVAFIVGFAGVAASLDITQPAAGDSTTVVRFPVAPGEATGTVAAHLAHDGLIRSAVLFQVMGRLQHLDTHLQPGIYALTPGMSMTDVLKRLLAGNPDAPLIVVPPGKTLVIVPPGARLTQFATYFAGLPKFDAKRFMASATTGVLPDGKHVSDLYWYVSPKRSSTFYALEGYLLPGIYFFNPSDDDVTTLKQMLNTLGEHLCPGQDASHLDAYILDRGQCETHAATVGPKKTSIFTEMEQRYFTNNDVTALYDALIVGSLVVRVSAVDADAAGVAGVYYNRYLASRGKPFAPAGDFVANFDADATVQYARDTEAPPKDGNWWAPLSDAGAKIASDSAYNTAVPGNTGLIPGPIAAPTWADLVAAATAGDPTPSPYYYVVADRCGQAHYASSLAAFLPVAQQASAGC